MAVAAEALAAGGARAAGGAAAGGAAAGGARAAAGKMPYKAPGYLTPQQTGQLASDRAEYEHMQDVEHGVKPGPKQSKSGGGRRSSGPPPAGPQGVRKAASLARSVPGRVPVASRAFTKLITAFFVGAFVLVLIAYLTGDYFTFNWQGWGEQAKKYMSGLVYYDLYRGQSAQMAQLRRDAPAASGTAGAPRWSERGDYTSHGISNAAPVYNTAPDAP